MTKTTSNESTIWFCFLTKEYVQRRMELDKAHENLESQNGDGAASHVQNPWLFRCWICSQAGRFQVETCWKFNPHLLSDWWWWWWWWWWYVIKISGPFRTYSNNSLAACHDTDHDEDLSDIRKRQCEVMSSKNLEDTMSLPFRKKTARHGSTVKEPIEGFKQFWFSALFWKMIRMHSSSAFCCEWVLEATTKTHEPRQAPPKKSTHNRVTNRVTYLLQVQLDP